MHRLLRRTLTLAAIFLFASCSLPGQAPVAAETPTPTTALPSPTPPTLDAEISLDAAGLRLRHPSGWASQIVSGTLTLATSEDSLQQMSHGPNLVVTVDTTLSTVVAAQYGDDALSNPEVFFEVSSGAAQQAGYTLSATVPITIDGHPGLTADLHGESGSGSLAVILGPDCVVRVLGQSATGSWETQRDLFMTILNSLSFFAPEATPSPTPEAKATQPDVLRQGPPNFVMRIGGAAGSRESRFVSARGLTIAPDGTLYLAESSRGVWVFAADGQLITTFGADDLLDAYDIVRETSGNLFVADYGRNAIARFRPDGSFVERWGSAGSGPDQFGLSSPQRIAIGPDGSIYALDSRPGDDGQITSSVMIFSPEGKLLDRVALPSDLAPADLAIDTAGNIYLAETFGGSVVKLAPDGSEMARFGDPAATESLAAGAIDIDRGGDIYLATYASGIVRLAPNGAVVARGGSAAAAGSAPSAGQFSLPNGIAVGTDDLVWVSDNSGQYSAVTALRLSQDPTALETITAQQATAAAGATPIPSENLLRQWATAATASSSYEPEYDPTGAIGPPDVEGCMDSPNAWAAATPDGLDTLELTYATPVYATGLTIYQNSQPGFISQVELIDEHGEILPVYSATPTLSGVCPLSLPITIGQSPRRVVKVRITLDQRGGGNWSEIDAVELVGIP